MQQLGKKIKTRELIAINQNMLRLHRSDSIDQILERINITGEQNQGSADNKIINRSTLINKYTLKLNDFSKELEYQNQRFDLKMLEPVIYTFYCFIPLCCFNIAIELSKPVTIIEHNKVAIVAIISSMVFISGVLLIVLKRIKVINHNRLLLCYIIVINVLALTEKSFNTNEKRSEILFYAVIAISFLMRLNSFFTVCILCIISVICYCQLSFGNMIFSR